MVLHIAKYTAEVQSKVKVYVSTMHLASTVHMGRSRGQHRTV